MPTTFDSDLTCGAIDAAMLSAGLAIWYAKLKAIERKVEEAQKYGE
jgi:hypothetical protein